MAIYETGLFARAMTIEAHRAGIPSFGLQHAFIHPEHEYYLHCSIQPRPDMKQYNDGMIVPSKTLVYGDYPRRVLTENGHYPSDAVEVVGCDWRCVESSSSSTNTNVLPDLRRMWFVSNKKIALVISQPSLTQGILEQLVEKLPASDYSILIKLHPDDTRGEIYRDFLAGLGFEAAVTRDYLKELTRLADVIFASIYSTAVLESLYQHKPVYTYRELELGYSVPWEPFTVNMPDVPTFEPRTWRPNRYDRWIHFYMTSDMIPGSQSRSYPAGSIR